ncbi:AAA family ATPase [Deinococcus humi]|uniref:Putative kinase/HD superfamily phosphodiesterase n=1 Tax=Deinococcus humi TaxID=662880 RepID=A0A7W8JVC0_9DEIO|nr:AAA family ATPase [Deinococcus humi]MBB5363906.1 putative kinase/HD superfamily phosphodiesterase [Deinococcus humi]GGO31567.1 HDIG domain-containing protein [Deinococcus humi]
MQAAELPSRLGANEPLPFSIISAALSPLLPLLSRLEDTPQDTHWHAEGNVAVHSALVVDEAHVLADAAGLSGPDRAALLLAAALHDIGKALTTREELDEAGHLRLRSRGHARRGKDHLAYRLLDAGWPPTLLLKVLHLIAEHHSLHRALDGHLERSVPALARRAPLPLLTLLARADARGRTVLGDDARQGEDTADLLELAARELGVWEVADPAARFRAELTALLPGASPALLTLALGRGLRDWESGIIHTPHEAAARVQDAARHGFPTVTVLCGPSGSGKSTLAVQEPDAHLVSLDALRAKLGKDHTDQRVNGQVMQAAREAVRAGLRRGAHVVWDAGSLRRDQRAQVLTLGEAYGALTRIEVAWTPPGVFSARNAARSQPVPAAVLSAQLNSLEFPDSAEAHVVTLHTLDGGKCRL